MTKQRFNVLSPDGFPIRRDKTYKTEDEAKADLKEWAKGFERQGYYSSVKGRIGLADLEQCCSIVPV